MTVQRAVVIGASHAGVQLAAGLRKGGWTGEIMLLGDEGGLPYQRPPLSKAYLAGKNSIDELVIRSAQFYANNQIQLVDVRVEAIDPSARRLSLSNGESLPYDQLALCTGARPRRLHVPGAGLRGVFYLRTAADVELIREAAMPGHRAVIVGGGYIGLETAASLRALGLDVTVLEAAERVLERVTAPEVSEYFVRTHRNRGVEVRTSALVEALEGESQVREVALSSGESIHADLVIVGVGVEPNTELAAAAGLAVDDGVLTDSRARTNSPDIMAAGDCASHDMALYGRRIRLESIQSAGEQAKIAAATMCGQSKEIGALPWFWSDQYDLKLQIAGLNTGYDEVVFNGDPRQDHDFTCYYLRRGELIAADCVNRPRDFMFTKRAIVQGTSVSSAELTAAR